MANERLIELIEQAGDKSLQQHIPLSSAMIAGHLTKAGVEIPVRCKDCMYSIAPACHKEFCEKMGILKCDRPAGIAFGRRVYATDHCSYGKRKSGTQPQGEGE